MAGIKSTNAQVNERVLTACRVISLGLHLTTGEMVTTIQKWVKEKQGIDVGRIQCLRYVYRARERLAENEQLDKKLLRGEAVAQYRRLLRDPKASVRDKSRILARLDRLYGLEAPVLIHQKVQAEAKGSVLDLLTSIDAAAATAAPGGRNGAARLPAVAEPTNGAGEAP